MAEGLATGAAQVGVGGDREHVLCCSKEMCERVGPAPPVAMAAGGQPLAQFVYSRVLTEMVFCRTGYTIG